MSRPYILRSGESLLEDLADGALARLPAVGNVYWLDAANGNDSNHGETPDEAVKSMTTAYAKLTANQHDVLIYVAGASSISLAAKLTWAKSYTHLIGLCAPSHVGQRARIFQTSTATGLSPLIDITASGCIFKDFYVFQGVADATSLLNVQVTGSRNYFHNVHFAGGGHATQAINGGASLHISGGSENMFERCTIGVDTIAAATGMAGLVFPATGGAARNWFKDCHFSMYAGNAGAIFVEALGNSGIDRYTVFERCLFTNLASTAMTSAFAVAAGFDPNNKRFLLKDCSLIGAADWDSADRGLLYLNAGTATGGGNAGIMLVSAAT